MRRTPRSIPHLEFEPGCRTVAHRTERILNEGLRIAPGVAPRAIYSEEVPQVADIGEIPQLCQRLFLNLADPFSRYPQELSSLLQSTRTFAVQTEPELDDFHLSFGEFAQYVIDHML